MIGLVTDAPGVCAIREIEKTPPPGWAVVRSRAAGICGTDVHLLDGLLPRPDRPFVLGHEGAGVVESAPPEAGGLRPGDRVVLYSPLVCGRCPTCLGGHEENCRHPAGQLGFDTDGTFADVWCAPTSNLVALPESVPFELAAILGCAGMTAVHAGELAGVAREDLVVVNAAGGVGLMTIQFTAALGARVYAIADAPAKAARAWEAGATDVVVLDDSDYSGVADLFREKTGGHGADHYFDLVGTQASLTAGIDAVAPLGTVVILTTTGLSVRLDPRTLLLKQARIIGSLAGSRSDLRHAVQLAAEGTLFAQTDQTYPLTDVAVGLARLRARQALGRSLVVW